ncbi:substrate-binding domain-containing protein [Casimicrobium huifangae]|jgi:molybdate-binding protein/molybdenum-dependent DNA-binding transcriptional regulator ModE|uniref:substrate-binding domain-containing protein n=1 Tax=Casimicrobium huifangae TaxID=2591109 RepID=UPI002D04AE83|nr:substrate-binding domain-containing protein [Casimicrobium huifangae]
MSKIPSLAIEFTANATLRIGSSEVDLVELTRCLRTLADTQSITAAANVLGVTYRTLWGRMLSFDAALGCKLIGKARGRGTQLTGKGRALLAALERHGALFLPPPPEPVAALTTDLARALRDRPLLRLMASHDYAIARAINARRGVSPASGQSASVDLSELIHLSNAGSVDCVRSLLQGDADLAGYHHVTTTASERANSPWERVESDSDFWSLPIMEREQGIIVAPRAKRQIESIADIAREGIRFVNRQRGSGTRILLDAWLSDAGISPSRIEGYDQEEFTHQAVAATVAAGAADAGPGLKAAAAQFNLGFIPLTTETYRLAGAVDTRTHETVAALIAATHQQAAKLPGYRVLAAARR